MSELIEKNNARIADFMGFPQYHGSWTVEMGNISMNATAEQMRFHDKWSWIIGMLNRLHKGEDFNFVITGNHFRIYDDNQECRVAKDFEDGNYKEVIFNGVIEWTEWFERKNKEYELNIDWAKFVPWFFNDGMPEDIKQEMEEDMQYGNSFTIYPSSLIDRYMDEDDVPCKYVEEYEENEDGIFNDADTLGQLDVEWTLNR